MQLLVGALFLACRWLPFPVSSRGRERERAGLLVSLLIRALMLSRGPLLMTSSSPRHLPKAPPPDIITL